jgi:hypothetical protein
LHQAYCSGLDLLAKGYEPAFKGIGRWNLEVLGLMSRRARAWMELPARIGQCKTPQDLVREQLQFWQTAAHDYSDGAQRLMAASGALAAPGFNGAWTGMTATSSRDYISFPDTKPAAEDSGKRERRAA